MIRRIVAENPGKFSFLGTGTYIVGRGRVAIIDAGPRDDRHVEAVLRAVEGETVTHLLVTHTHGDHSPATAAIAAATGAPTYGYGPHPQHAAEEGADDPDAEQETPEERAKHAPDTDFVPDVAVRDGDLIRCDGFTFECLHTPGHISNHVCYALRAPGETRALFTGDHVMGWSTTIVPPPDGDMDAYVANLRRLLDRDDEVLWPTHGPPVTDPRPFVEALIEHRLERERQILAHLALGPTTIADMVSVLYADVRVELHKPAARSVLAHLVPLVARGVVHRGDGSDRDAVFSLA
jgi:glyoxylase-like metal-dependent hydrolase (beta-lactamase superfamily II)